jgi:uncharacterized protein YjcR
MPAPRNNDFAVGNSGGGAPEGNQNAVGNSGGAPPEGNANAATHHGWSDLLKHYHRLTGDTQEFVDGLIESAREMYARHHGLDIRDVEQHIVANRDFESEAAVHDAFRKLGAIHDQRDRTDDSVAEEGMFIEEEHTFETDDGETVTYTNVKANPALEAKFRSFPKRRALEKKLGLIRNERFLGCG